MAFALSFHGFVSQFTGDPRLAQARFTEAVTLLRELEDTWSLALPLNGLAETILWQGDVERAARLFTEDLTNAQHYRSREHIATALTGLGQVALARGDVEQAVHLFQEGLQLRWELGDVIRVIWSLQGLMITAHAYGQWERAVQVWGAVEHQRTVHTTPISPSEDAILHQLVADARAHLDASTFEAAHANGWSMRLDQVVAYALEPHVAHENVRGCPTTSAAGMILARTK